MQEKRKERTGYTRKLLMECTLIRVKGDKMVRVKYDGYVKGKVHELDLVLEKGKEYDLSSEVAERIRHTEGLTILSPGHKEEVSILEGNRPSSGLKELRSLNSMKELREFARQHGLKSKDNNIKDLKKELEYELGGGKPNITEEVE